jgi:hypothetical protein
MYAGPLAAALAYVHLVGRVEGVLPPLTAVALSWSADVSARRGRVVELLPGFLEGQGVIVGA